LSLPHWIKWNKVKGKYEINNNMKCFEQSETPKITKRNVDGVYLKNFQKTIDDLIWSMEFEDMNNSNVKGMQDFFEIITSIDRWNIDTIILNVEELHKITKTESSIKWLKFLKKYKKQFTK